MNPDAQEFTSKRSSSKTQQPSSLPQGPPIVPHNHHHIHHHQIHFAQPQQPVFVNPNNMVAPPTALAATKLRAVAPAFEPAKPKSPSSSTAAPSSGSPMAVGSAPPTTVQQSGGAPPPPPPSYSTGSAASSPTKATLPPPPPADVIDIRNSKLSGLAQPFTPKKLKTPTTPGAPTFPTSPVSANGTASTAAAPAVTTTKPASTRQAPPPIAPTTPPSTVEVAPASESSIPSSPVAEEPLPFAKSLLPVPSTPKAAPAEPIKFNTTWTLHADDHPATFGTQTYAPPVQVRDVSDLQTFWRLWRYCPPPSRLVPSFTYIWFRRDIKPQWEDPKNKNGGSISIALYDRDRVGQTKESMDDAFLLALMSLAGESLPESTVVNGIFLKARPNRPVVLQYWTNVSDESKLRVLATGIRTILGRALPTKTLEKLEFFSHSQLQQAQQPAAVPQKGKQARGAPARPKAMEPDFTF